MVYIEVVFLLAMTPCGLNGYHFLQLAPPLSPHMKDGSHFPVLLHVTLRRISLFSFPSSSMLFSICKMQILSTLNGPSSSLPFALFRLPLAAYAEP